jgi:putative FmdB family regulatory protein
VPFYDYVCSDCGHEMEVRHSVHGHGPAACPICHGQMRKAISAAAVHFKGSGWARKEPAGRSGRATAKEPASASTEGAAASSGESPGGSTSKNPD